jgi:hypothetical protein
VSAAQIDTKAEYNRGENIIAHVPGNFVDPITESNVYFYRGYARIPMDYDVVKIDGEYYILASLIGKDPGSYSLVIKDVTYYGGGSTTDDDIKSDFTINNSYADFSINPGYIYSSNDFSIKLTSLVSSSKTISVSSISGLAVSGTTLNAGQIKNLNFDIILESGDSTGFVTISSDSTSYSIPAYVWFEYSPPEHYCGNGVLDAGELCDGYDWGEFSGCIDFGYNSGELTCNSAGSTEECTFDTSNCYNVTSDECEDDSNCENEQVCIDGFCVEPPPPDPECGDGIAQTGSGELCDGQDWGRISGCSDLGFDSGTLECLDCSFDTSGCFYENLSGGCMEDSDCPEDHFCINYFCFPYSPECEEDDDCSGNKNCINGTCIECEFDSHCENKTATPYCFSDECVQCVYNIDCDEGFGCNVSTNTCYELPECVDNNHCNGEDVCYDYECVECKYDHQCGDNERCNSYKECEEVKACTQDSECGLNEICAGNICIEKGSDVECTENSECTGGKICDNYKCIDKPDCRGDNDCESDETCVDGECISTQVVDSCSALNGTTCKSTQTCDGSTRNIGKYTCCVGECVDEGGGGNMALVGWILLGVIIIMMVFIIFKVKTARKNKPNLAKVGLRR